MEGWGGLGRQRWDSWFERTSGRILSRVLHGQIAYTKFAECGFFLKNKLLFHRTLCCVVGCPKTRPFEPGGEMSDFSGALGRRLGCDEHLWSRVFFLKPWVSPESSVWPHLSSDVPSTCVRPQIGRGKALAVSGFTDPGGRAVCSPPQGRSASLGLCASPCAVAEGDLVSLEPPWMWFFFIFIFVPCFFLNF